MKKEGKNKISFSNANITHKQVKFIIYVYRKSTFRVFTYQLQNQYEAHFTKYMCLDML